MDKVCCSVLHLCVDFYILVLGKIIVFCIQLLNGVARCVYLYDQAAVFSCKGKLYAVLFGKARKMAVQGKRGVFIKKPRADKVQFRGIQAKNRHIKQGSACSIEQALVF